MSISRSAYPTNPVTLPLVRALLTSGVIVAGCALVALGLIMSAGHLNPALIAMVALLAAAARKFDLDVQTDSRISLAFVPVLASAILFGLPGVTAACLGAAAIPNARSLSPLQEAAYNLGALMIAGASSVVVLAAFGGTGGSAPGPELIAPAAAAALVNFMINTALTAARSWTGDHDSLRFAWTDRFLWMLPHYLALGLLSLVLVAAYTSIGLWGLAIFLVPPAMLQLSLKQYVDKTASSLSGLPRAHKNLKDAHAELADLETAHAELSLTIGCLRDAYGATVRSLIAALDARDRDTCGHSERVAELAIEIAAEMGVPRESDEARYIEWGSLLHDVGKIAVPDAILRKPSSLSEEEWAIMRAHPLAGYEILRSVDFLAPAAEIVLSHHERFDGTGYPAGLVGDDIPLGSRIFAIADAFDAMTADRVYRQGVSAEETLAELVRNSGTQFDPAAVRAFLRVYENLAAETGFGRVPRRALSESLQREIAEAIGFDAHR